MPSAIASTTYSGALISVTTSGAVCNALDHGAIGDGVHDDTSSLQATLSACAQGGTALLPAGHIFLSTSISLPSNALNTAIRIDGVLRFINDTAKWASKVSCLALAGAQVALLGSGVVDGQGAAWWPCAKAGCARPTLVNARGVKGLLIRDLLFRNSPNHNLELYASPHEVVNVTILAPDSANAPIVSHNTDGAFFFCSRHFFSLRPASLLFPPKIAFSLLFPPKIAFPFTRTFLTLHTAGIDVHGSPAYIHNCTISTGDDHIAFHANDTLVENCQFGTGHGASVGSLGTGIFLRNITVRNSSFDGAVQALRIKADIDSSGALSDVLFEDLRIKGAGTTLQIQSNYPGPGVSRSTLRISNVTFSRIAAEGSGAAGSLICSADAPCQNVFINDVVHTPAPKTGWACAFAHGEGGGQVVPPLSGCLLP